MSPTFHGIQYVMEHSLRDTYFVIYAGNKTANLDGLFGLFYFPCNEPRIMPQSHCSRSTGSTYMMAIKSCCLHVYEYA